MQDKNLEKIKKHLSIIFALIVFVVVLFLWFIYFSWKYISDTRSIKMEFSRFISLIEKKEIKPENFWKVKLEFLNREWPNHNWVAVKIDGEQFLWPQRGWFMNFIIIDNNNKVLSSDIREEIPDSLIINSVSLDKYYKLTEEKGFLIKKLFLDQNRTFIIYKSLDYTFIDYIRDIFWYTLISLVFTFFVYLIGRRFIDKIFIPVEKNIKEQNDFIHNAGHELKTPISVIDSNIQLMLEEKKYDEEMLYELKKETLKLNSLIDSLVNLSDFDEYSEVDKLNLKDEIEEILSDFKYKIEEKKLDVKLKVKKDIKVLANKNYLYIFLSNIIWNAIKYNKDNWEIKIEYKDWFLIIIDNWIWIKKEYLEKVYDRFFKWDIWRNTDWFWIWLSLVKKIAWIYKWNITIDSIESEGTIFKIKF